MAKTLLLLVFCSHSVAWNCNAQEGGKVESVTEGGVAKLPYLMIANMLVQVNGIFQRAGVDFDMELRITSKKKGVAPADIRVNIDNGKTRTPIKLGPGGLLTLPRKKDYFHEKCFLTTDQPKGSLDLGMQFTFGKAEIKPSTIIDYTQLFKFMTDLEKVAPDLGKMLGKSIDMNKVKTVPYRLLPVKDGDNVPSGPKARIVIKAKAGDQIARAGAGAIVEIPWSKALVAENPKVVIPNFKVVIANDLLWNRLANP